MSVTCDVIIEDNRWARLEADPLVSSVVEAVLTISGQALGKETEVSFVFTNDDRIRELNLQWRKKDAPTNVLSFPATSPGEWPAAHLLGDVVLAYETIAREAVDESKAFEHHAAHMIAHGFLHLIGYDHEGDEEASHMESLESRILLELGMPDPWERR